MSRREFIHHIRNRDNTVFRPSVWDSPHIVLGLIASIILTWYTVLYVPWTVQYISLGFSLPVPLTGLVVLVFLSILFHTIADSRLVLCSDYVLYIEGFASWKEHSVRIHYEHIREIEINQTILQRLFNTGDILVLSVASKDSSDIHMRGVRAPRKVKDLVESRINSEPMLAAANSAFAD